MKVWLFVFFLFLQGCGSEHPKNADNPLQNSPLPSEVTTAELLSSMIATELGNIGAPPAPGAMIGRACIKQECQQQPSNSSIPSTAAQAIATKEINSCSTYYGTLSGSVQLHSIGVPELTGCVTSSGPFGFRTWPPKSGRIEFRFGGSSSEASKSLERTDHSGKRTELTGVAKLRFNGTNNISVMVRLEAAFILKKATTFLLETKRPFTMSLDYFADSVPRVFNGNFTMTNKLLGQPIEINFDNLEYLKTRCCHPTSGSLILRYSVENAAKIYMIRFYESCGESTLIDSLGRATDFHFPEC